eukprot:59180-Rhodomonas_salina.1
MHMRGTKLVPWERGSWQRCWGSTAGKELVEINEKKEGAFWSEGRQKASGDRTCGKEKEPSGRDPLVVQDDEVQDDSIFSASANLEKAVAKSILEEKEGGLMKGGGASERKKEGATKGEKKDKKKGSIHVDSQAEKKKASCKYLWNCLILACHAVGTKLVMRELRGAWEVQGPRPSQL